MRKLIVLTVALAVLCGGTSMAQAQLIAKPQGKTLKHRLTSQTINYKHAKYLCHNGRNAPRRWGCKAMVWLGRELRETQALLRPRTYGVGYWAARQMWVANIIGAASEGDPWPHCPDPYDGGGSWYATVACENSGSWYDSPGFYRCGLQFDPMWERKYGRLCP